MAAGLKLSCIVSAVADSVNTVRLFPERKAEVKTLRLGPWLKDRILLTDLGFFDYNSFDKIERYGGFFVSRLKGNADPLVVKVNQVCRGNSVDVVGKKLRDVLPLLKRQLLDVEVEVLVKRRSYKGKTTRTKRTFRMVQIQTRNPNVVKCLVWISILTFICSRQLLRLVRKYNPAKAHLYTHLQWAKAFAENAQGLMKAVLNSMGLELDLITYFSIMMGQGQTPNINRKRLMEPWTA